MTDPRSMIAIRSFAALVLACMLVPAALALDIHVSPTGSDTQLGTLFAPVRTLEAARKLARSHAGREPVTITMADGTYYLDQPLVLTSEDSGRA